MKKLLLSIFVTHLVVAAASANDNENAQKYLSPQQETELERRASLRALESLFLAPDLIRKGNELKEETEKAQFEILQPPTRQNIKKVNLSMTDATTRTINVYPNQITTITISDSMGVAWPLSIKPIIASDTYSVSYDENVAGFLTVETSAKFVPSNLIIAVKDRLRPIQFQLVSDNSTLDYAVEITIDGKSPINTIQAKRPYGNFNIPEHNDTGIAQFLSSPPESALELRTIGNQETSIWYWNNGYVIRTPYKLIEPSKIVDVQSRMDEKQRVYFTYEKLDVLALLNTTTSQIINIEVVGNGGSY